MANVSAPLRENISGLGFDFFPRIWRGPVRNHFKLVAFFAGANSLVFLCVSRRHAAIARGAAVQFHEMFFAKIDTLFSISPVAHWFFQQFAKCFPKLGQVDPVLRPFRSGDARLHLRQIQIDIDAVIDLASERHAEHFLRAKIILEHKALLFAASRGP